MIKAMRFDITWKILAGAPGQVWSRGQLMDKIYPDHRIVSERTIDSHIKKLRKNRRRTTEPGYYSFGIWRRLQIRD